MKKEDPYVIPPGWLLFGKPHLVDGYGLAWTCPTGRVRASRSQSGWLLTKWKRTRQKTREISSVLS